MNIIRKRRSIRQYADRKVPDEIIKKLLEAAMCAPSAGNQQPWQFIVATEKELLKKISATHINASMVERASIAILVCGDLNRETHKGYWMIDCAAATENILLEVVDNNLGAVWVGIYPREDRVKYLKNLFKLPENIVPFAVVAIGYTAEQKEPNNRYDKVRIHYNKW
jgi:nitroreductase